MWRPGTPIVFAATDSAERLTTTVGLVKAVKFMQDPNNAHAIYWGDSTLNSAATPRAGVTGIVPQPTATIPAPQDAVYENDAPNGINANLIFCSGTLGETLLWSYLEQ